MLTVTVTFLLLVAVLAIPLTLTFRLSWGRGDRGWIRLQWLFGLVRVRLAPFRSKAPPGHDQERPKRRRSRRSAPEKRRAAAVFRRKAFRRRIIRFAADLWRAVRKKNLRLHARIGLGDPADTGQLWSVIGPVAAMLAGTRGASVEIEPAFFDTAFELEGGGELRLVPLRVMLLAVGLVLSPAFWQGVKQMREAG